MKRVIFIFIVLTTLFSSVLFGQTKGSASSLRVGVGRSILGTGDIRSVEIDGEFMYRLSSYFAAGLHISYGTNVKRDRIISYSLWKSGLTLYINPFRSTTFFNPQVGGGINFYDANFIRRISSSQGYISDGSSAFGLSIIVRNTFRLSNLNCIVLSLFVNPYFNNNINSGVSLGWTYNFSN